MLNFIISLSFTLFNINRLKIQEEEEEEEEGENRKKRENSCL
jgi:hypothetical protein